MFKHLDDEAVRVMISCSRHVFPVSVSLCCLCWWAWPRSPAAHHPINPAQVQPLRRCQTFFTLTTYGQLCSLCSSCSVFDDPLSRSPASSSSNTHLHRKTRSNPVMHQCVSPSSNLQPHNTFSRLTLKLELFASGES